LYVGHEAAVDVVMMAFVPTLPLSALVNLMRFSSTRSTVPTWTPSAPITSICSLILLMSDIADVLSVDAKVKRHQSVSVQCFATGSGSHIGRLDQGDVAAGSTT